MESLNIITPPSSRINAKKRLKIQQTQKEKICYLMLQEVLSTISKCRFVDKIIIVSKDKTALMLGKSFNAVEIFDDESGVNNAISLADDYLSDKKFDCSIIFPQDIPIMKPIDIDNLLSFVKHQRSVIVVPSRQFNGTNALVRCPADIIDTKYDMGSYTFQVDAAIAKTKTYPLH